MMNLTVSHFLSIIGVWGLLMFFLFAISVQFYLLFRWVKKKIELKDKK